MATIQNLFIDQGTTFSLAIVVSDQNGDAKDLTAAIEGLLSDEQERNHMKNAGISRAQGFTWGAAAAKTAGIYQSLVG